MKRFFLCLVCVSMAVVSLSARNKPVVVSTHGNTGEYASDVIRTENVRVTFNQGAKASYPYTLRWQFVTGQGQTLSQGEWSGQHEWGTKTNVQNFTITMPTSDLPDIQTDRSITFRCALIYHGNEVDYCSSRFDLKGRHAQIRKTYFEEGERHCYIHYDMDNQSITPRVDLYINGQCASRDYRSGQLVSRETVGYALGHTPAFNEEFTWQLRVVDPLIDRVIDSSAQGRGYFAPFEITYDRARYSYSLDKLTISLDRLCAFHVADWSDARLYMEVRDAQNNVVETIVDGKSVKAEYTCNFYSGYNYSTVNLTIPLHAVADYRGGNRMFSGTLHLRIFYDGQWKEIGTQNLSFEMPYIDRKAFFHTDDPLFNQHDGPVILHFTMNRCAPGYVWRKKMYEPRIAQWKAWGAKFLYVNFSKAQYPNAAPLLPNEREVAESVARQLIKLGAPNAAPTTLVFDGDGNCLFMLEGFQTNATTHPEWDEMDEILQSIAAYYRNK